MDEYDARIRIDRAERVEGKDVVGTFEHPAPGNRCLMLQVLQEALVKPIGVEVSGLIQPTAIPGIRYVVSKRRLAKTCAVISEHSCGEEASIGCMRRNSGANMPNMRSCRATRRGRGSGPAPGPSSG